MWSARLSNDGHLQAHALDKPPTIVVFSDNDIKCTSTKGKRALQLLLLEYKGSTWPPERTCQTKRHLWPLDNVWSWSIDQPTPLLCRDSEEEEAEGASVMVNSRPRRISRHVANLRTQWRNDHHLAMGRVPLSSNPDLSSLTSLQIKHLRTRHHPSSHRRARFFLRHWKLLEDFSSTAQRRYSRKSPCQIPTVYIELGYRYYLLSTDLISSEQINRLQPTNQDVAITANHPV